MDLLEQYNAALRGNEDVSIKQLNSILDKSFNRLIRRLRFYLRTSNSAVDRSFLLLMELRQLVPIFKPDRIDDYDRLFTRLATQAQSQGLSVANALLLQSKPAKPRIDISIPLEATVAAAAQAKGYLRKHGERFATTSAEIVAKGIAEGRRTDLMVREMRSRLGVVKSRAEAIVRTESLRAYNDASNTYYAAQGVELVMYYATADDRSCAICAPRAGNIYRRQDIRVPLHPRCRCYLAPWDAEIANMDPQYATLRKRHTREVASAVERMAPEGVSLNRAAVFEQFAPTPLAEQR